MSLHEELQALFLIWFKHHGIRTMPQIRQNVINLCNSYNYEFNGLYFIFYRLLRKGFIEFIGEDQYQIAPSIIINDQKSGMSTGINLNELQISQIMSISKIFELDIMPENIQLDDYMNGFYDSGKNYILDHIQSKSHNKINVTSAYKFDSTIKNQYPNLNFNFKLHTPLWSAFENYKIHPVIDYKNFICSFNGSAHVGRKLLVAILEKFKYFDSNYCSKNFCYSKDSLDGNIEDLVKDKIRFYH